MGPLAPRLKTTCKESHLKIGADVVVELVQMDGCIYACDADLPAECVYGLRIRSCLTVDFRVAEIRGPRHVCAADPVRYSGETAPLQQITVPVDLYEVKAQKGSGRELEGHGQTYVTHSGRDATPSQAGEGEEAGVVPAGDVMLRYETVELALAHQVVRQLQPPVLPHRGHVQAQHLEQFYFARLQTGIVST